MLWLIPALLGLLLAVALAWARGLHTPAFVLLVLAIALAFVIGKRIEAGRDADWQEAARRMQGSFRRTLGAGDVAAFGTAPWTLWAADGELQFPRAIVGDAAQPPFALLQVRYSVRERRGEEHPDSWYEVTVAVIALAEGAPARGLLAIADGDYAGAHNGRTLFLWKKGGPGAGASLTAAQLPQLLQQARALAARQRGISATH
jgi:hypothetical protein